MRVPLPHTLHLRPLLHRQLQHRPLNSDCFGHRFRFVTVKQFLKTTTTYCIVPSFNKYLSGLIDYPESSLEGGREVGGDGEGGMELEHEHVHE